MKRGGTLEAEWLICHAELVSEVTLIFVYTFWLQGSFPLLFLCWSLEPVQSSQGDYAQASGFSDSRAKDWRYKFWQKHSQLWFSHREKEPFTVFKTDLWLTASCINNGDLLSYVKHKNYPPKLHGSSLGKQSVCFSKGWIIFKRFSLFSFNSSCINRIYI